MAYAVTVGSGFSKMTVRFPTPEQALAKAKDDVEHGERDITIREAATGDEFTVDEFAKMISEAHPS